MVAVDWSGDARAESTPHPKLWAAEAHDGEPLSLAPTSRMGVVQRLVALAEADPHLLVALDFSFSFPRWFVEARGFTSGPEVWPHAATLDRRASPFFGWKGSRRPAHELLFRSCEEHARADGFHPSSTFQVNGPGSVGTGSVLGMAHLVVLRAAGFAIWPWDPVIEGVPVVVEGYPRAFARSVVKSDPAVRAAHVATLGLRDAALAAHAIASDDAFDAAVMALGLMTFAASATPWPTVAAPADVVRAEGWMLRPES
ncbi:MAG TPA: hypothetical protein VGM93_13240 [Acidimicrobiales bacterium]